MGAERRQQPRHRCNIPCELRIAGRSLAGLVRNVSAGGLGLVAEAPAAEQGDEVGVTLELAGRPPIELSALVWHVRAHRRGGDKPVRSFGLVLSDAAPEFARLVERLGAKATRPAKLAPPPAAAAPSAAPASAASAAPEPPPRTPEAPEPPRAREYRIRIKQNGGSRSCRIVASGASPERAAAAALAEVGAGWIVLEVTPIS